MSLTTGFTAATGLPPRAEPGSAAPSGRAAESAAAFAAVAQGLADGTASGTGARGEHPASANPDAASARAEAPAGTVNDPAAQTGRRDASWDHLGPSLVGRYYREQQQPAQMLDHQGALPGTSPTHGSGPEAVTGASAPAGSEPPAPDIHPVPLELTSGQTGPVPAETGSGSAARSGPSTPNSAAPVSAPLRPQPAVAAETASSVASVANTAGEYQQLVPPTAVTAQTAGIRAMPAAAAPVIPRPGDSGTAEVSLPVPMPEGTVRGNQAFGSGTAEPAVRISAPGTVALPVAPLPAGTMPGKPGTGIAEHAVRISAPGTFVRPASPEPTEGIRTGSRASGTATGTAEPAVRISAPGTFVLPAGPALPGEAAVPAAPVLPGAAPVLPAVPLSPGAAPQSAGGSARMAPVSAAAASGFAGLEVSVKDAPLPQPPVAPAPMAAPVAPASPFSVPAAGHTPAAAPPQQLLNQVSQPLVRLAAAGPGEHVMTLSVNPENLGPVTVRAVISSDGVRVEMFAPTDTAREALRHILAELRRDLAVASTGPAATLTLSDQNSPGNGSNGGAAHADDRSSRTPTDASREPANPSTAAGRPETSPQRSGPTGATTALDVMA